MMMSSLLKSCARTSFSRQLVSKTPFQSRSKHTLVLIRHGQSVWNKENRFTGWVDVPLSDQGRKEAAAAGQLMLSEGFEFDIAYSSVLKRANTTLWLALEEMNCQWIPQKLNWRLNERHYGALAGLDKAETADKYGADQVLIWRRSYATPPPLIEKTSEHWPGHDRRYADVPADELPLGESLALTADRVMPLWNSELSEDVKAGKRVLVAAHGNSLRALVMHLDGLSEEEVLKLNIPTGVPLVYTLDENLKPIKDPQSEGPLSFRYLGDADAVAAAAKAVAEQGAKKN